MNSFYTFGNRMDKNIALLQQAKEFWKLINELALDSTFKGNSFFVKSLLTEITRKEKLHDLNTDIFSDNHKFAFSITN